MAIDTPRPATVLDWATEATHEIACEPKTVLASAGSIVTCPSGHSIYELVEDLPAHTAPQSKWFKRIDGGEHPASGAVPPCPACGQKVFPQIGGSSRFMLFINGQLVGSEP